MIKRYLFELAAFHRAKGVERRNVWISDAWLAEKLAEEWTLDRLVEVDPEDGPFPLPLTPIFLTPSQV